jgi:hypothetical protein
MSSLARFTDSQARNSMVFRLERPYISAHAEAEDRKLKKELLEVLALKVPFRNRYSFWESASESNPVAGTIARLTCQKPALKL